MISAVHPFFWFAESLCLFQGVNSLFVLEG